MREGQWEYTRKEGEGRGERKREGRKGERREETRKELFRQLTREAHSDTVYSLISGIWNHPSVLGDRGVVLSVQTRGF